MRSLCISTNRLNESKIAKYLLADACCLVCAMRLKLDKCDSAVNFLNSDSHPNEEALQEEGGYCEKFILKRTR